MNKKEVLEIRRQFSPENCAITRICGCYVDHEKEKKMEMKKAFLSLPEEEAFKYFDIFKHTLSGTIGVNFVKYSIIQPFWHKKDPFLCICGNHTTTQGQCQG